MLTKIRQRLSIPSHPGTYSIMLALGWTTVMALSLQVSTSGLRREVTSIAQNIARAYIDKDILYRNWNAMHGGIYVPVQKGLAPNPFYPSSLPERDVITPSGRHLTLVNPSYMLRQIYELAQKEQKISGHLTSLKPIRPENKASAWEAAALRDFEGGKPEVSSMVMEGGARYLRLMRPLVTEESCLTCHAHQGYKRGDIRGGISINLPMALLDSGMHRQFELLQAGHVVIWLLGLVGLYVGYTGLKRRTNERDRALEELKRVNAVLESQASIDSVTGILNRRKFSELLQVEIQEAKRYKMPLALIFFDVDHFKSINDSYGHEVGDSVLRELACVVTGMIRNTDIIARFGGEEFVILVHNNDARTGRSMAEKIRSRISRHSFSQTEMVTCSFGVAQFYPEDSAESFMKRADEAMYVAKHAGRNRVETRCNCESSDA